MGTKDPLQGWWACSDAGFGGGGTTLHRYQKSFNCTLTMRELYRVLEQQSCSSFHRKLVTWGWSLLRAVSALWGVVARGAFSDGFYHRTCGSQACALDFYPGSSG